MLQVLENGWDTWPAIVEVGDELLRRHINCKQCRKEAVERSDVPDSEEERARMSGEDDEEADPSEDEGPLKRPRAQKTSPPRVRKSRGSNPHATPPLPNALPISVDGFSPIHPCRLVDGRLFDDYYNGPTCEDNPAIPISIINFPLNPYGQQMRERVWTMFRDYGFRIEPSFYQMFNRGAPNTEDVRHHLLPIPPYIQAQDPNREPAPAPEDQYSLTKLIDQHSTAQHFGPEHYRHPNIDLFLCGRIPTPTGESSRVDDEDLVDINLALDEMPDVDVKVSLDIDSIIWVTHDLRFKKSVNLVIGITYNQPAPISKHNHVYVNILPPRSECQAGRPHPPLCVGLHALPHMRFLQIGDGAGSLNTYIFFPRMKHKGEHSNRSISILPPLIQRHFIESVLLPALSSVSSDAAAPYINYTLRDFSYKARQPNQPTLKSIPIHPEAMKNLQKKMRDIICENEEDLGMFGSFFFVTDGRGLKLWTMEGVEHEDPLSALKSQTSRLDWEYMLEREHGELLLDLGISFTPSTPDNKGVVGLWKLDALHASYAIAGYCSPTIHHSCTLRDYGNLQAEMRLGRRQHTHFAFRQSYNLAFEVVRQPGRQLTICSEPAAYQAGHAYTTQVSELLDVFNRAKGKSYGVREEIRLGGKALLSVLMEAKQLVSEMCMFDIIPDHHLSPLSFIICFLFLHVVDLGYRLC